ncbi:beta-lactamase family protein [Chryseobacterium gallinarum]|uniref:serine hydrolase domain-containing protein n=1 Tax=Chryseobacterium gallinarum TaxID=1324352 RepID=UPI002023EC7F|nr:serine hydrolase domain-containing protein [Chryseobacterium gallinarum]MCL8537897.1 beta-lactamase family protein [Chryseobacterium gallinarum]
MKNIWLLFLIIITEELHSQQSEINRFSAGLDSIRAQLKIPGMAVAVKQGNAIILERGLGFSDVEKRIPVTPKTTFRVASVTKTFTSTLVMRLIEQGKLNLDNPVHQYGIFPDNISITVRQLLTHTSEGIPGTYFHYNGYRYGLLGPILEKVSGKPFYQLLMEEILIPLQMNSSAPSIALDQFYEYRNIKPSVRPFFDNTFTQLAKPYELTSDGKIKRIEYLNEFGAFGGLATSVQDLLKYSEAIDNHLLIPEKAQKQIFTPHHISNGSVTPYGLGWFVQYYKGVQYYWHYGQTQGESALFVKVPSLQLTLVVLCNTDKLSQPFPLADGDLFMSPVASLFYHHFIDKTGIKDQEMSNKELIIKSTMANIQGDTIRAQQFYNEYKRYNKLKKLWFPREKIIAGIQNVGIDKHLTQSFVIAQPTSVKIYGVGENCSWNGSSWCDYGWIEDQAGNVIWQMQNQSSLHAGGAIKNQKVSHEITLLPGSYSLHYKSDSGHAYNHWDSFPPEDFFWGIIVLKNH